MSCSHLLFCILGVHRSPYLRHGGASPAGIPRPGLVEWVTAAAKWRSSGQEQAVMGRRDGGYECDISKFRHLPPLTPFPRSSGLPSPTLPGSWSFCVIFLMISSSFLGEFGSHLGPPEAPSYVCVCACESMCRWMMCNVGEGG